MGTSVTITDLPDDVRRTLERGAARAGLSLDDYLRGELSRIANGSAGKPRFEPYPPTGKELPIDEWFERVSREKDSRVRFADALKAVHEARREREQR